MQSTLSLICAWLTVMRQRGYVSLYENITGKAQELVSTMSEEVRDVLTSAAKERQEAKAEKVTVARTVEEERRVFEQTVLERVNESIAEVDGV